MFRTSNLAKSCEKEFCNAGRLLLAEDYLLDPAGKRLLRVWIANAVASGNAIALTGPGYQNG